MRAGYIAECPNVGKLLKNLKFSLPMENEIMGKILNDGKDPEVAANEWLKANPAAIEPWLAGVTTKDGGEALPASRPRSASDTTLQGRGARPAFISARSALSAPYDWHAKNQAIVPWNG